MEQALEAQPSKSDFGDEPKPKTLKVALSLSGGRGFLG